MQNRNKILDDISQLMTNAMGVAQGAKEEAETAAKSMVDRWLADRDFVTREEFDAVRAMAKKAREENEALAARLDALETQLQRQTALNEENGNTIRLLAERVEALEAARSGSMPAPSSTFTPVPTSTSSSRMSSTLMCVARRTPEATSWRWRRSRRCR